MKKTLLALLLLLSIVTVSAQTTTNIEFRIKQSGHWNNPAIWEYKQGVIWLPATRPPNGNDSVVTIVTSLGTEVTATATAPKLILQKNSILYISTGTFTLWGKGNFIDGDVVLRRTGELKYKTNAHIEFLTVYKAGRFFWTGGKLYTTVLNYGTSYFQTADPKSLYAMFINRGKLEIKDCIYTAANASAYVNNSGKGSWLNYTNSTVISVPGTSETQNLDGALLTFNFANKIDKLNNTGTIDGVGSVQVYSIRNNGTISPGWPFVKFFMYPGPMEVISQLPPTGIFDLNLDPGDGDALDSYITNHSLDLATIRLAITHPRPVQNSVDTIVKVTSGSVSGNFLSVSLPPGFFIQQGSTYVVARYSTLIPLSGIGAAKTVEGRYDPRPFIPTLVKRGQVFRIQGLQSPAVLMLDANGREVFNERSYGNNKSLSKLRTGIHFYRVTTSEKVYTGKIMVVD